MEECHAWEMVEGRQFLFICMYCKSTLLQSEKYVAAGSVFHTSDKWYESDICQDGDEHVFEKKHEWWESESDSWVEAFRCSKCSSWYNRRVKVGETLFDLDEYTL